MAGLVVAGAVACGSSDTSKAAPGAAAHNPTPTLSRPTSGLGFELAASPETTAETGIVRWKGGETPGGDLDMEGVTASGVVRLMIAAAPPEVVETVGSMAVEVRQDGGGRGQTTVERGALAVRNGKVESNTLPASVPSIAHHLATDLKAAPRPDDGASCQQAINAFYLALAEEAVACDTGNFVLCGLAVLNALNADYYMNSQCANCGGSCSGNTTCDGAGNCICISNGCQGGQCGNVTDNCGRTLYCGACNCTSTGCLGRCGNVLDNCGNQISCGCGGGDDGGDDAGGGSSENVGPPPGGGGCISNPFECSASCTDNCGNSCTGGDCQTCVPDGSCNSDCNDSCGNSCSGGDCCTPDGSCNSDCQDNCGNNCC